MTLEEAIRHAEEKAKCGGKCGEDHAQLAGWLKELQERRAAELEKRTEERTETHACDTISRQAAIDALGGNEPVGDPSKMDDDDVVKMWERIRIINIINKLPSAQPEIVRCKDCRHYLNSNEKCALIDTRLNFYATEKRWNGDSFCSWAERRTDE